MNKDHIVVNTLVFQKGLENGGLQHELFAGLRQLGIRNVEVRREYIRSGEDLHAIAETARENELETFYSVPDSLFHDGMLQRRRFDKYMKEAEIINARVVKFTLGDFKEWQSEDIAAFHEMTRSFKGLITVENDQTQDNGKMKALLTFYKACETAGVPIFATFDVGNGLWVGEDPLRSAYEIKRYTRYVHLKDVAAGPEATFLGEGDVPWRDILTVFEPDVFAAIEYPCGDNPFDRLKAELSKLTAV